MLRSLFLLLLIVAPARAADFDPDEFVISYWCNPPARFTTTQRYQEIKEANFTVALGAGGQPLTVAQNRAMLDLCQQNGMKAIVYDTRMVYSADSVENKAALDAIVKDYSDHPALLGYHVCDEPGAGAYPGLAQVVAHLREKDPKRVAYINLMPTWARDIKGALGTDTYDEYVRSFVKIVKPAVISYDDYPFMYHQPDRADWIENFDTVRKIALEHGIPFWHIALAVQHGDYRNLTEPELRYEAMQVLAFGGRGLLWFTYWSPAETDASTKWEHAIINPDGSRDPHYEMVKSINADVKAIGDALAKTRSIAVFQHGEGATIKRMESPIVPLEGNLTIGVFKQLAGDGKTMALVTSRDYRNPMTTRVTIEPVNASIEQFNPADRSWSAALHEERGVVPLTLPPGGGILLRW